MHRSSRIERIVLFAMVMIMLAIGVGIITNLQLISQSSQIIGSGGVWDSTQVEREALRYDALVQRISLGDSAAVDDYALQRDIFFSRIPILRDNLNGIQAATRTPVEEQMLEELENLIKQIKQQDVARPTPDNARQLMPLLERIRDVTRTLSNERRQIINEASDAQRTSLNNLRLVLVLTLVGLVAEIPVLIWLVRKRLDTSLQSAYVELESKTRDLETSREELQEANQAAQSQNTALEQALHELENTIKERASLQQAMRQMEFPVIPILQQVAVMPLIGVVDQPRSALVTQQALDYVKQNPITMLLLDATGITAIDSAGAAGIIKLRAMLRMLGCDIALAGITPVVAEQLILHQISDIRAYNTLREGILAVLKQFGIQITREHRLV